MADRFSLSRLFSAMRTACFSEGTVENVRYHRDAASIPNHKNEDVYFVIDKERFQACAVCDGHDGASAANLAVKTIKDYITSDLERWLQDDCVETKLKECIMLTNIKFFEQRRKYIEEKRHIEAKIPRDVKSYQASQLYPCEVARLEELEPLISGGCTAVVAVVCGNKLYVANVGDSRAVVVYQTPNGALETLQLSTDHDVKNEDELKRLEKLGLDPDELKRAGRLGPQENTRSIGDYNIKEGYRSVDVLSHASGPPGIAEPSVNTVDIDKSFLYLMVMSDGVYKSIETAVPQTTDASSVVAKWFYGNCAQNDFVSASQRTLKHLAQFHEKHFNENGNSIACKRDDMTLLVYNFHAKARAPEDGQQRSASKYMRAKSVGQTGVVGDMVDRFSTSCFSEGTVENVRYHRDAAPVSDHKNEDVYFVIDKERFQACAVCDGHDGASAAKLAVKTIKDYINSDLERWLQDDCVETKLKECIMLTDITFFEQRHKYIEEKRHIEAKIPHDVKSYQASQLYPCEVARLEELEPLISGGCTAVVAVVCGNKLYVANVGDSRAVVVYQTPNGALETLQLSTDHDVKNVDELKRLEKLGLDPEELKRAGRLGPQENTRSIGDYNIKRGYKSVDVLRHASGPPGIAEPSINILDVEESFLYLMLMSDGVYKCIEATVEEDQTTGAFSAVGKLFHAFAQYDFTSGSIETLKQLAKIHEKAFNTHRNSTACRKRDDMTLVVYSFCAKSEISLSEKVSWMRTKAGRKEMKVD